MQTNSIHSETKHYLSKLLLEFLTRFFFRVDDIGENMDAHEGRHGFILHLTKSNVKPSAPRTLAGKYAEMYSFVY